MKKINSVITSYLLGASLLLVSLESFSWTLFGKQTYEECILENMKGVTNNSVAQQIQFACAEKTKEPSKLKSSKCRIRNLTKEEANQVSATAEYTDYDSVITLTVHNGNRNISIGSGELSVRGYDKSYVYKLNGYDIEPLKVGALKASVVNGNKFLFEDKGVAKDDPPFMRFWKLINMQAVICE